MGIKVRLGQLLFLASETTHHERPLIMRKNPRSGDWEGRGRLGMGIGGVWTVNQWTRLWEGSLFIRLP
jgi:hypothetical protein